MYRPGWCQLGDSFYEDFAAPRGLPFRACHVGTDAATRLAAFARSASASTCLLLSDDNTYHAGGEDVARALAEAGLMVQHRRFGNGVIDGTDTLGEEVVRGADGIDVVASVGSGTLTDLAKYAGDKLKKPVLLYPTAASMNGYTSGITALKVRGLKRTLPCTPAAGIFANPEHVAIAPQRMTAAGVADFLSKCSSSTDWRASHILQDVAFDPKAREFFEGIQDRLLEAAPRIGKGEPEAVALALEALLLSGFSMVIAGSSAPASGGEHLISHFLDMKAALYGTPHDLHGTQVGVATVYCLALWEKILALTPADVDFGRLIEAQPSDDQVRDWIRDDWGDDVGVEVQAQWDAKKMSPDAFQKFLDRVRAELPRMQRELPEDLLPSAVVARAIRESGGPIAPDSLEAPIDDYKKALTRARYIRNRFTVLDLAQDLCVA